MVLVVAWSRVESLPAFYLIWAGIGVALALMLHVTLALAIVYAVFATLDAVGEGQVGRALRWGGVAVGAGG